MNRPLRLSLLRRLALALVAAQALAFALSPVVEGRTARSDAVHIERSHSGCAVVHRPDTCIACQLLSVRTRAPLFSETHLPPGGRVLVILPPRTTHHVPRTDDASGVYSRAPPRSA